MRLQHFVLGELGVNTYLLWEETTRETVCLDPGGPPAEILPVLTGEKLKLKYILLTHGHYDHIAGVNELKAKTGALVAAHVAEAGLLANPALNLSTMFGTEVVVKADQLLNDGDLLALGPQFLTVTHTPGHTPGSIILTASGLMFSGDTLFAGSVGRTDFPGGDPAALSNSLHKLLALPGETRVFPGHGPATLLSREKEENPFLRQLVGE